MTADIHMKALPNIKVYLFPDIEIGFVYNDWWFYVLLSV